MADGWGSNSEHLEADCWSNLHFHARIDLRVSYPSIEKKKILNEIINQKITLPSVEGYKYWHLSLSSFLPSTKPWPKTQYFLIKCTGLNTDQWVVSSHLNSSIYKHVHAHEQLDELDQPFFFHWYHFHIVRAHMMNGSDP